MSVGKRVSEKVWWWAVFSVVIATIAINYVSRISSSERIFVVDEKGNKIIPMGDATLHVPPDMNFSVEPESVGKIFKFQTFKTYPQFFSPPPPTPFEMNSLVRIELRTGGREEEVGVTINFDSNEWAVSRRIDGSDLMEYQRAGDDGAWGSLTYVVTGAERTPRGNPIVFRCTRKYSKKVVEADICESSWKY